MTTITKKLNLLDIADIESALSDQLEREVTISEVECNLIYSIPPCGEPGGAYLEFQVGDDSCDSFDLFVDLDGHFLNGERLSLDEPWVPKEEIFNFDVNLFKAFKSWVDSSD